VKRFVGSVLLLVGLTAAIVVSAAGLYWLASLGAAGAVWLGLPPAYGAAVVNMLTLGALVVMTLGAVLTVAERKWSAMMQDRLGPNRIKVFGFSLGGVPFLLADAVKMLTKEDTRPTARSHALFILAPIIAFASALALVAVLPFGPVVKVGEYPVALQIAPIDGGLLFIFAIASLAVYGTTLAGWASNNKLALLGGVRAASQMISYEVSLGLALVGSMMVFQSLRLEEMTLAQGRLLWGAIPALGIFLQPVGFLVFFISAIAETKRAPFDLPEGESEIVGYFVEYSGMKFGMLFLSEFVEIVVLAAVVTAVFLGGWHPIFFEQTLRQALEGSPIWWGAVAAGSFLVKMVLLCWLQLAIRWTVPRFRFDQVQKLCWQGLLPVALANVLITGAVVLLDGSLELAAVIGFVEIALLLIITFAAARAPEPDRRGAAHVAAGH